MLQRALDGRLWLPPSLAATLRGNLQHTIDWLESLLARARRAAQRFLTRRASARSKAAANACFSFVP